MRLPLYSILYFLMGLSCLVANMVWHDNGNSNLALGGMILLAFAGLAMAIKNELDDI